MKRLTSIFLILSIIFISLSMTACSTGSKDTADNGNLNIVATIFPQYDFVRQIGGDKVNLSMLLPPGSEAHTFDPTVQDIQRIMDADIFIYVGGVSDSWIDDILDAVSTEKTEVISLMDITGAVEEEITEGMDAEEENDDEVEYDEHVWTSPKNAIKICDYICEKMCSKDVENASYFKENLNKYVKSLNELDANIRAITENASNKTLIFGDRFPFRYFTDEYGLDYYAAFPGCASDTEPSISTIAFLINKVKEEKIPVVFYIEFSNQSVADTICEGTGAKKLLFHSCHNVSPEDFNAGITYLDLMTRNVENLREAIG
ncbi:MAG: metal ABC transporter substrate-binding protein [Acutalibacteraceae bacterium]